MCGLMLITMESWNDADQCFQKALSRCNKSLGDIQSHILDLKHGYAVFQRLRGFYKEAETLYQDLIQTSRITQGISA